jgi:hypothetical protein
MHLPPLEEFLVGLQTLVLAGLCFRMWQAGLYRIYIYFFGYLLLLLLQPAILPLAGYGTVAYGYAWLAAEAAALCFYTLIVLECYAKVLQNLAGIASISRRYIKTILPLAMLASVLLMGLERTPKTLFQYFYALERAVVSSLLICVLLMTAFLAYYPIPLSRNVIIYSVGYAVYFLAKAVALFVRNVSNERQSQISATLLAVSAACLLFWMIGLNRSGEAKAVVIGHKWQSGDEERLISQLTAINAGLSRAARK